MDRPAACCFLLVVVSAAQYAGASGSRVPEMGVTYSANTSASKGPRIVGGQPAFQGQFPYQVSLRRNGQHSCGGTIISSTMVLTAAHCVVGFSLRSFSVVAGSTNRHDEVVSRQVKRIYVHGGYIVMSNGTPIHDIAVVELSSSLNIGRNNVNLAQLSTREFAANTLCTVSGWGITNQANDWLPNILQYVNVPIISYTDCARFVTINNAMICAGNLQSGGIDSCQGDSGGPLICSGLLVGVVSFGRGCAQPRNPGVYASVPYYNSWIRSVSSSNIVSVKLVLIILSFLSVMLSQNFHNTAT